jgi:hypothetical protein
MHAYLADDIVRRAHLRSGGTSADALLAAAMLSGQPVPEGKHGRLTAGPVTLTRVYPDDHGSPSTHYFGAGPAGLYAITAREPDDADASVDAAFLPAGAASGADLLKLFDFSLHDLERGRTLVAQLHRVKEARDVLAPALIGVVSGNMQLAATAVAEHATGQWRGPSGEVFFDVPPEAASMLTQRARPLARILHTGWFSAAEDWVAEACGGRVLVFGQDETFGGLTFVAEDGTALDGSAIPAEAADAFRELWFRPVEPEETSSLRLALETGLRASDATQQRIAAWLSGWAALRAAAVAAGSMSGWVM